MRLAVLRVCLAPLRASTRMTARHASSSSAATATAAHSPSAICKTTPREVSVRIPGLTIAGLSYGDESSPVKVLGLHGWMDNAATHHFTSAAFAQECHFVAIDLPGHGKSGKRPVSDVYDAGSYALAVMETAAALGWTSFMLCGHSMGAGISSMVAGALSPSNLVTGLILLEGIGMNSKEEASSAAALIGAYRGRTTLLARLGQTKTYPSVEAAAAAREATTRRYPGAQSISHAAAMQLVQRGTVPVPAAVDGSFPGGVAFRHDQRLSEPGPTYMTETQMLNYLHNIRCPTLCVTATRGWPWSLGLMHGRIAAVSDMEHHHIVGGHHCHLDDDTGPLCRDIISSFLHRRWADVNARITAASSPAPAPAPTATSSSLPSVRAGSVRSTLPAGDKPARRHPLEAVPPHTPARDEEDTAVVLTAHSIASTTADWSHEAGHVANAGAHASRASGVAAGAAASMSPAHVYIARTMPYAQALATNELPPPHVPAPHAAPNAQDATRVHVHTNAIVLVAANEGVDAPRYAWRAAVAAAHGNGVHAGSVEAPTPAPAVHAARDQVWCPLPDSASGVPSRLLHARGLPHASFGAYAPALFLDTMPTLEAVLIPESSSTQDAHAKRATLSSRGDAY